MNRRRFRRARHLLAAAAATLVVAGCGGGPIDGGFGGPVGDIDPDAILRVTSSSPTRNLDPYLQTSYGGWGYLTVLFDRLTTVDKDGNLIPGLAESWQFARDGSYLELKLRTDVSFHDGTAFDAAAVAANIHRGQNMEGSTVTAALQNITSVEEIDDYTVRLHLVPGTGVELPGVFSTNVGMMISPKAIAAGTDLRNGPGTAGSGAYVVTEYVPEESLSLVRADGAPNWDPKAGQLAGIEFEWIPDARTRLNGMKTGMTDLSWVSSANEVLEAQTLGRNRAVGVHEVVFRNVLGLYMRPYGDLAEPEVRQAVAAAIDPAAVSALFSGTCTPHRQLYPAGSWPADENYEYPYPYDPGKARALVQAAGGARIALTFAAGTNTENTANVLQSSLSQAGIDADLNPVPNTQNEPRYIAGDFESMVANSFNAKTDPAETVNTFLFGAYALANDNPQIRDLTTRAADPTLTEEQRAPLYHQAWDLTLKEAMFVPICNQTNATLFTSQVVGAYDIPWADLGIFDLRHVAMTE
ncbi:peptide ABC transporter substrate-binding protein [Nocardia flavorosea]|uniref:ABC transporter substrate-binding protein n=1 Tax=Nocardia flavorosea TaxID=53429 RepID=UPI0018938A34|nr:ABC transporter substrate-binding protein [Nocardia flavorosea]MBF6347882.1 peptide ABC transporter substrate-binding protein [Nocardia flavorosea]